MQISGVWTNIAARWATISFYLFSGEGKFEQGGLFTAFDRWGKTSVVVDAGQKRLSVHTDCQYKSDSDDQVFAVEKDRFVFKDDLTNGKSTPPYIPFKYLFEVHAD